MNNKGSIGLLNSLTKPKEKQAEQPKEPSQPKAQKALRKTRRTGEQVEVFKATHEIKTEVMDKLNQIYSLYPRELSKNQIMEMVIEEFYEIKIEKNQQNK